MKKRLDDDTAYMGLAGIGADPLPAHGVHTRRGADRFIVGKGGCGIWWIMCTAFVYTMGGDIWEGRLVLGEKQKARHYGDQFLK